MDKSLPFMAAWREARVRWEEMNANDGLGLSEAELNQYAYVEVTHA